MTDAPKQTGRARTPPPSGASDARLMLRTMVRSVTDAPASALFGLTVILFYVVLGVFAPWIAPYGEAEILGRSYEPWAQQFVLGTDQLGRDVLTRLIYGARNSVGIALLATLLSFVIGASLGLAAAIRRGWFDVVFSRLVDLLMSIPSIIFALMLLTVFGTSVANLILIIAVLDSTRVFRLARAVGLGVTVTDFVEAARLRGEGTRWILLREVLPNVATPLIAEFALRFCFVFLTISALSFLGVGLQPPMADWGSMLRESATLISYGDPTPLLPAAAIALLTVGVNFVADWLLQKSSGVEA